MSNDLGHGPLCSRINRCAECGAQMEAFQNLLPRWGVLGRELYHSEDDPDTGALTNVEAMFMEVVKAAYEAGIAHILLWAAAVITAMDEMPNVTVLRSQGDHPQWTETVDLITDIYRHAHDGESEKGQDLLMVMDDKAGNKARLYLHCYFAAGLMHIMEKDCTPHQRAAFMSMAVGDIPDVAMNRPGSVYLAARIAGAYAEGTNCADAVITRVVMEDLLSDVIYTLATAMSQHYRQASGLLGVSDDGEVTPVDEEMTTSPDVRLRGAAVAATLVSDIATGNPDMGANLRAGIGTQPGVLPVILATLGASYAQAILRFMNEIPRPEEEGQ